MPFITVFESFYDFEKDKKPSRSVKNVKKRLRTIYHGQAFKIFLGKITFKGVVSWYRM